VLGDKEGRGEGQGEEGKGRPSVGGGQRPSFRGDESPIALDRVREVEGRQGGRRLRIAQRAVVEGRREEMGVANAEAAVEGI
jgi:hypothetical protein